MKLIFVYNADTGVFNAITDTIHKVMSPDTYECRLCQITYGMTSMQNAWREFLSDIEGEKVFLHRNEFQKQHPDIPANLPAIFTEEMGQLYPFLTAEEINECSDLESLMETVKSKLSAKG